MYPFIITFLLAAILAFAFTPLAITFARRWGVIDYPGDRRVHTEPIPRLGGAAIYLSFWLAVFLSIEVNKMLMGIFIGSTLIFVIGVLDDIKGIRPLYKLMWQISAAVIPLLFGLSVDHMTLPLLGSISLGIFGYVFALFWIVGIVNTVNISDGLDGLAAGICFIAALILFWAAYTIEQSTVALFMMALAGAALGFLFYNFHPARIFMGDSGSMFLGYIIATASLWGLLKTAAILGLVFPMIVLGMPLADMVFTIVRRSWKGRSLARADRGHLHHRLLDVGLTQREAVFVLYLISGCFGLAAVFYVNGSWYLATILTIINLVLILRIMFRKFSLLWLNGRKQLDIKDRRNG